MLVWSYLRQHRVDANGDNLVTLGEIDGTLKAHRMERFNQVDDNQDGVLASDEIPELLWRRIENADFNGKVVSFEELEWTGCSLGLSNLMTTAIKRLQRTKCRSDFSSDWASTMPMKMVA